MLRPVTANSMSIPCELNARLMTATIRYATPAPRTAPTSAAARS